MLMDDGGSRLDTTLTVDHDWFTRYHYFTRACNAILMRKHSILRLMLNGFGLNAINISQTLTLFALPLLILIDEHASGQ